MKAEKVVERLQTAEKLIEAINDMIKETGQKGIPSGHLYAMLMGKITIEVYQAVIAYLVKAGKITNRNHLLIAKE